MKMMGTTTGVVVVQSQLCPTLCDPMDCSTPGLPVLHYLLVCPNSCPLHWWCHPAISSSDALFSFCPQSFPVSGIFPVSWLFASDDQNTGASASASVLPMRIQGWSPLEWTGWISLLSKGLSVSSPASQFESITHLALSLHGQALASKHDYWKSHSFD